MWPGDDDGDVKAAEELLIISLKGFIVLFFFPPLIFLK